jgi:hypothetical protein
MLSTCLRAALAARHGSMTVEGEHAPSQRC